MQAEDTRRPTALVTGASSGIGEALARRLAAEGHDVVLVARNAERLQAVAQEIESVHGVSAHVLARDLSDPRAPDDIYRTLTERGIRVDVLVNNAGFGGYGFFQDTDLAHELGMIQVNVTALVHLAKLFVRDMVARGSGRVLNVSSTAAYQPGPLQPVYYASKAFVQSFSEAIDNGLRGTGVRVTTLVPGPAVTAFHTRARTERSFRGLKKHSADEVARVGVDGLRRGKRVVVVGRANRLLAIIARMSPRRLAAETARRLQAQD
ncbi:MAG: SDR family oxidoreductase [Candidatus Krumholzibacteria bacterium]|nr:SDR family oxidoreductase [Candidatus Krumholzibacteria bacterium]